MNNKIETQILKLNENEWINYLDQFEDASIYQTLGFTHYSKGGKNTECFILKIDDDVAAISLVRIVSIPVLNRGIAYLRWGPLWQRKNKENDIKIFDSALQTLYQEYVTKRKYILRILSGHSMEDKFEFEEIFRDNGFIPYRPKDMTVVLDISKDEDILRANLHKHLRNKLNKIKKLDLNVEQGHSDDLFDIFISLYKSMHARKKFKEYINVESFKKINSVLPEEKKMQIFICKSKETPVAAIVVSAMGNSGIYLLGGMNDEGLKLSASYLLHWETIKWLKDQNIKFYDFGGIDPVNGKGVYFFKTRWGGDEVTYVGGFEASKGSLFKMGIKLLEKIKK